MFAAKTYRRRFRMHTDLDFYTRFAQDVIDGIETDTVKVFRPDDVDALANVQDADGAILLDARCTLPVRVREWLPVVCQFIRWESAYDRQAVGEGHEKAMAYYRSNAGEVLWPEAFDPAGPGALFAGAVLRREKCIDAGTKDEAAQCDRLRFVLAHEMVHAIHAMRYVVPAFINWRTFWRDVLNSGGCCDLLGSNHHCRTGFLDHYGTELELAEVLQFWPSHGKRWFDAFHEKAAAGVKPPPRPRATAS